MSQPRAIWTCPQSGSAATWSRPLTRADEARLAQKRQSEALAAATAEYRRLSPHATGDTLAVSGEVNRMIAAAINADPQWFQHGPDASLRGIEFNFRPTTPKPATRYGAETPLLDWRERLVCSQCGSRKIDMVVTGEQR